MDENKSTLNPRRVTAQRCPRPQALGTFRAELKAAHFWADADLCWHQSHVHGKTERHRKPHPGPSCVRPLCLIWSLQETRCGHRALCPPLQGRCPGRRWGTGRRDPSPEPHDSVLSRFWLPCILEQLTEEGSKPTGWHSLQLPALPAPDPTTGLSPPRGCVHHNPTVTRAPAMEGGRRRGQALSPPSRCPPAPGWASRDATLLLGDVLWPSPSRARNLVLPLQVMCLEAVLLGGLRVH